MTVQATADDLVEALQTLPTAGKVQVRKTYPTVEEQLAGAHDTWLITFESFSFPYEYGFQTVASGNHAPVQVGTEHVRGSGARFQVDFVYQGKNRETISCAHNTSAPMPHCTLAASESYLSSDIHPVMGSFGDEAGQVYLSYRHPNTSAWEIVASLKGSDTRPYDHFGHAVSFDSTVDSFGVPHPVLLAGSPNAATSGNYETQSLACFATTGRFYMAFKSQVTDPIPFNVTAARLEVVLESLNSITDVIVVYQFHNSSSNSVHEVGLSNVSFCQSSRAAKEQGYMVAMITFLMPENGDLPLLETYASDPDQTVLMELEDSTAEVGLNGYRWGQLVVEEVVKGNRQGLTSGDGGYRTGKVYVFEPSVPNAAFADSSFNSYEAFDYMNTGTDSLLSWRESASFSATDSLSGDLFGHSVSVSLETLVIGAPETKLDAEGEHPISGAGAAYVYSRNQQLCALPIALLQPCAHSNNKEICNSFTNMGGFCQLQKLVIPNREVGDNFGYTVLVKSNTLVVSAPYKGNGAIFIWKRNSIEDFFVYDQAIYFDELSLTAPSRRPRKGSRFGISVSAEENTLAVGADLYEATGQRTETAYAPSDDVSRLQAGRKTHHPTDAGAVFTFSRATYRNTYNLQQEIIPRQGLPSGRFGASVSVDGDSLVVSEPGAQASQVLGGGSDVKKLVMSVCDKVPQDAQLEGLFALSYRVKVNGTSSLAVRKTRYGSQVLLEASSTSTVSETAEVDTYEAVQTAWLPHNVSAAQLKFHLETELNTGEVTVQRRGPDSHSGYSWILTFHEHHIVEIPLLPISRLAILNGVVTLSVEVMSRNPGSSSGSVHAYTRTDDSAPFIHQAILRPEAAQLNDMFGGSMSFYGDTLVVGAFNRGGSIRNTSNTGGVFIYRLAILNLQYGSSSFSAYESDPIAEVLIEQQTSMKIVDRHPSRAPTSLRASAMEMPVPFEHLTVDGTATSKAGCAEQNQGDTNCLWTYSMGLSHFDYVAKADYIQEALLLEFGAQENHQVVEINLLDDHTYESPSETVNCLIRLPGFFPVQGGKLWAILTILEDDDGAIGWQSTLEMFASPNPTAHSRMGHVVAAEHGIVAVGVPRATLGGKVHVYSMSSYGEWLSEEILYSPSGSTTGGFGTSIDLKHIGLHRMIIGAPHERPPAAYVRCALLFLS